MSKKITPYKDNNTSKKVQVTQMFDSISENYDSLNRVISLGIDKKWRKKVVDLVRKVQPKSILDIATGTADLAIALAESNAEQIVGLDLSAGMLEIGKQKIKTQALDKTIQLVCGDSENLPFTSNFFDVVTVAFGVRNFENLDQGLSEIYRVLKPSGVLVILETSVPQNILYKIGYQLYCKTLLPIVGKLFSKDHSAYSYLRKSAAVFPSGTAFNNILVKNGFIDTVHLTQTFGAATIYRATKA